MTSNTPAQQGGSPSPSQQQQGTSPAPQQQGQQPPVFRDWAAI